jgi:hypothetical protein
MPKKWRWIVKHLTERPIEQGEMKKHRTQEGASRETVRERRLRVLRLRKRVADGTYRPDLEAVARRLAMELHFGSSWH